MRNANLKKRCVPEACHDKIILLPTLNLDWKEFSLGSILKSKTDGSVITIDSGVSNCTQGSFGSEHATTTPKQVDGPLRTQYCSMAR